MSTNQVLEIKNQINSGKLLEGSINNLNKEGSSLTC
jgi:hypothetical protein